MYDWKIVIPTCSGSEINDFIIIIILFLNQQLPEIPQVLLQFFRSTSLIYSFETIFGFCV